MATVLITGTNRGIGLEYTKQFLDRGDTVLGTCRDPGSAEALSELAKANSNLQLLQLDVSDSDSMANFSASLAGQAIDIFINNAGVYGPKTTQFGDLEAQTWSDVMQVNSIAPVLLTQLLMDNMRAGVEKKLVYVTSKMGSVADNQGGGAYVYRSSKSALNAAVKSLSVDLAGEGMKVALLHPGWVLTDMGGPNALIDTTTSVSGMMQVIDGLSSDSSGSFFNYDGSIIPW